MPASPTGLTAPLPLPVRRLLRQASVDLRSTERRTLFPPRLLVGCPGGACVSMKLADQPPDFGVRIELIHAMVRRAERAGAVTPTGAPWVWVTRSGDPVADNVDLEMLAPAWHAFAEAGEQLTYFAVTKYGWHDPRTGLHRSWTRLRPS